MMRLPHASRGSAPRVCGGARETGGPSGIPRPWRAVLLMTGVGAGIILDGCAARRSRAAAEDERGDDKCPRSNSHPRTALRWETGWEMIVSRCSESPTITKICEGFGCRADRI